MQNFQLSQLTLGLCLKDEATFTNFYAGKNKEIVTQLKKIASGESDEHVIYLCGIKGQGLSHLLQACCHHADQHHIRSVYLPFSTLLPLSSDILTGLESVQLICLDDLHLIAAHPAWEASLFHLYNRVLDTGGKMIIAAHDLPKNLPFKLPDLVSRLAWGIIYQLHALTDNEKLSVLMMRAKNRGIILSEEVGKYILTHCSRHMGALLSALDALDKATLAQKRRLTIPFAKEILKI